ncbi:uncharacterized protein LOC143025580 isoform X2 [Oratosquilla oratoria]
MIPSCTDAWEGLPEVGEGPRPPSQALVYHGGVVNVEDQTSYTLNEKGYKPYPFHYLTTHHALLVTRALATQHASYVVQEAKCPEASSAKVAKTSSITRPESSSPQVRTGQEDEVDRSGQTVEEHENDGVLFSSHSTEAASCPDVASSAVGLDDKWTAEVTKLNLVDANLSILMERLRGLDASSQTLRRLEALTTDLPTLTQFLQFASSVQAQRIPSVGPVGIGDIWVPEDDQDLNGEEAVVIRIKSHLPSPLLRDVAWVWLTLVNPDTLRERYTELCDEYCNSFNKTVLRQEASSLVEELSYFDVMRDLGENFLHAFLTMVHKFVCSGTWFLDRKLYTDEGFLSLVEVISFLVDNGIVGSIFVV